MEFEERTAEVVRARFRDGVDDRAGVTAELCAERIREYLKLADGFDAEHVPGRAAGLIELVVQHGAVNREQIGRVARSVDTQLGAKTGAGAAAPVVGELHARRQVRQLDEAASVERQSGDLLLADQRTGRRRPHIYGRG